MISRLGSALVAAGLFSGTCFAADDPFCGKWKVNFSKFKLTGQQLRMEDLGNNKIRFTQGTRSDTLVMDGTDQPLQRGGTMALTKLGPNAMRMVIKMNGKVTSSMVHSISDDGKIQTIRGTTNADGTTADFNVETKRVGGGSGWSGIWESTDVKISRPDEWDISSYKEGGLTFYVPAQKETLSINFDGKDYEPTGPEVPQGWSSSGKRTDQRTLEISNKFKGEVSTRTRYEVSGDGKTLTLTEQRNGQAKPMVIVYEKM